MVVSSPRAKNPSRTISLKFGIFLNINFSLFLWVHTTCLDKLGPVEGRKNFTRSERGPAAKRNPKVLLGPHSYSWIPKSKVKDLVRDSFEYEQKGGGSFSQGTFE